MIKYWIHVINPDTTGFVKEAFKASESLAKDKKKRKKKIISPVGLLVHLIYRIIFS